MAKVSVAVLIGITLLVGCVPPAAMPAATQTQTCEAYPRLWAEFGDPMPSVFTESNLTRLALFDGSQWWPSAGDWAIQGRTPVGDPFEFVRRRNPQHLILAHVPGPWAWYTEPERQLSCTSNATMCQGSSLLDEAGGWMLDAAGMRVGVWPAEKIVDYSGVANQRIGERLARVVRTTISRQFDGVRMEKADWYPYVYLGATWDLNRDGQADLARLGRPGLNAAQIAGAQMFVNGLDDVGTLGGAVGAVDASGVRLAGIDLLFIPLLTTQAYSSTGCGGPEARTACGVTQLQDRWQLAFDLARTQPSVLEMPGPLWDSWPWIRHERHLQRLVVATAALTDSYATIATSQVLSWCDECGVVGGVTAQNEAGLHWLGCALGPPRQVGGVWMREFQHGLVVVNGSITPQTAPLPWGAWRKIRGWYDTAYNDGQMVGQQLTVAPLDAYMLWRESTMPTATASPTPMPTATPTVDIGALRRRVEALETVVADLMKGAR